MVEGEQTFLFADLAGFTALTEAHGDLEAADRAAEFCQAVRSLLPGRGAVEVKTIGDAVMVRVPDPGEAIRLALEIVSEIDSRPLFPAVRVGMHTGDAVERDGDWFGAAVNLAARVSGAAGGGEVLVTEATRRAAGSLEGVELESRGRERFRNVAEAVGLIRVLRAGGERGGLPIDPVCRMTVGREHAVGRLVHRGVEYHFCSLDCAAAFAAAPDRYVTETSSPSAISPGSATSQ